MGVFLPTLDLISATAPDDKTFRNLEVKKVINQKMGKNKQMI